MKFVKAAAGIVKGWPVDVRAPDPDTGELTDVTIHIDYKVLTREEQRARLERDAKESEKRSENGNGKLSDLFAKKSMTKNDDEIFKHVLGWDFTDEDGEPLPFNRKNFNAVMALGYFAQPIGDGLLKASNGAPEKNL